MFYAKYEKIQYGYLSLSGVVVNGGGSVPKGFLLLGRECGMGQDVGFFLQLPGAHRKYLLCEPFDEARAERGHSTLDYSSLPSRIGRLAPPFVITL